MPSWTAQIETYRNTILPGDAGTMLYVLPESSIHCCVTSPPYWGLRSYLDGTDR
jgi:DNA modification methylase